MRTIAGILLLVMLFLCTGAQASDLYVRKAEHLPEDFFLGMDVSSVLSLEASGVRYRDTDGTEKDLFALLSENGVNLIRVRVWNDPFDSDGNGYGGGNNNIEAAVEIGRRAAAYGLPLLVDFHYSDFWADPSKQQTPKAWEGMDIKAKAEALYTYTADCLSRLKAEGIRVSMVQLGNETNGRMCGERIWMNIVHHLMKAGSRAVREVYPDALVAVHFTNPESADTMLNYASKLAYYDLDYDVFGTSYYPYWHGTLDNLRQVLGEIAETYGKKVMVMETSYAYTLEDGDFSGNTIGEGGDSPMHCRMWSALCRRRAASGCAGGKAHGFPWARRALRKTAACGKPMAPDGHRAMRDRMIRLMPANTTADVRARIRPCLILKAGRCPPWPPSVFSGQARKWKSGRMPLTIRC